MDVLVISISISESTLLQPEIITECLQELETLHAFTLLQQLLQLL